MVESGSVCINVYFGCDVIGHLIYYHTQTYTCMYKMSMSLCRFKGGHEL